MACGGCRKNNKPKDSTPTKRGVSNPADLTQYAFLTPAQLRLLKQQGKLPGDKK